MTWEVCIELELEHAYYAPNLPPLNAAPTDPVEFNRQDLILRQTGRRILILAEDQRSDLPMRVGLDLIAQDKNLISVTEGGNWKHIPQISFDAQTDETVLEAGTASVPQVPTSLRLAQVNMVLKPDSKRDLKLRFKAMSSHWAYHVVGPGNDDVFIEDPEGAVLFDPLGAVELPGGSQANVIRSRVPLPARARPDHRFSLSRPGPFGPRTLIPVLPSPEPLFASVPAPDGAGAIIQSDIYVPIF
ncbi:MAG: hypothetical protein AB8B62_05265 [Roseobacter sp.]